MSFVLVVWLGVGSLANAFADVRLALLIGHERGWKKDPPLRYALRGDVLPMARALRQVGFSVKTLQNPNAASFRRALSWVKLRLQRAPKITTFVFYYSGHADRRYFHLGRRGSRPVSYREFVSFLRHLSVPRRIAIVDSCFSGEIVRQFGSIARYRDLVRKGATGVKPFDLSRTLPSPGEEKGLQIMSSSLDYAWESRRYRSSVFTHHLLLGLRGRADRDQDGKISVDELFNFVSDQMVKDVRQKPQLFGVIHRSRPYALAPAYHSSLRIDADVVGTIQVSVANFVWRQKKVQNQPLRLAVVHGWGTVGLRRGRRCWRQRIFIPKGGDVRLADRWTTMPCHTDRVVRKGSLLLPASVITERKARVDESFAFEIGGSGGGGVLGGGWGGSLGLRWQYFGLALEGWGGTVPLLNSQSTTSHLYTGLRVDTGLRWQKYRFALFAGPYLGLGLLWQDLGKSPGNGMLLRYGIRVLPSLSLSPTWSLFAGAETGFELGVFGGRWLHLWHWRVQLGCRFRL